MIYDVAEADIEDIFSDLSGRIHTQFDVHVKKFDKIDNIEQAYDDMRYEIDRLLALVEKQAQSIVNDVIDETIDIVGELNDYSDEELIERINKNPGIYEFVTHPSQIVTDYYQFKTKL